MANEEIDEIILDQVVEEGRRNYEEADNLHNSGLLELARGGLTGPAESLREIM